MMVLEGNCLFYTVWFFLNCLCIVWLLDIVIWLLFFWLLLLTLLLYHGMGKYNLGYGRVLEYVHIYWRDIVMVSLLLVFLIRKVWRHISSLMLQKLFNFLIASCQNLVNCILHLPPKCYDGISAFITNNQSLLLLIYKIYMKKISLDFRVVDDALL